LPIEQAAAHLRHQKADAPPERASSKLLNCLLGISPNIGDAEGLVIHPASTTHQTLSSRRAAAGVPDEMISPVNRLE